MDKKKVLYTVSAILVAAVGYKCVKSYTTHKKEEKNIKENNKYVRNYIKIGEYLKSGKMNRNGRWYTKIKSFDDCSEIKTESSKQIVKKQNIA